MGTDEKDKSGGSDEGIDDENLIRQGAHPSRCKSVYLTDAGIDYAKKLMEKYGIEDWQG